MNIPSSKPTSRDRQFERAVSCVKEIAIAKLLSKFVSCPVGSELALLLEQSMLSRNLCSPGRDNHEVDRD